MYTIEYSKSAKEDISKLSKTNQAKITQAIEKKLKKDPIYFGKPLQYSLKNFRKIRVGNYRVIY